MRQSWQGSATNKLILVKDMHVQYPMSESKRMRIISKAEKAIARRMTIKKRKGPELELACRWCAIWMAATGITQFERGENK